MNIAAIPSQMRRRFTTADVMRMVDSGLIGRDERIELIEGELTLMSPKHNRHEWLKTRLIRWFSRRLGDELILAVESTLNLSERTFVEPDITIYSSDILPEDVRGPDVLLAIEIGDSSLSFDLKTKAPLYARYGIAHYWAVNAETFETHLHSAPKPDGYPAPLLVAKSDALRAPFDPSLELKLDDLR